MEDNNASNFDKFFDESEKNGNVLRKSAERSTKTRIKGNDIYVSKNHNQNAHKMALSAYSLSVAFAPNDSEELALAYGNRSALLLHLHKYDECLIDIDRSLKVTNSKELKVKLLNRKTKCLNLIENSNVRREPLITGNLSSTDLEMLKKQLPVDPQSSEKLELPKMVPSEEILCASESVTIRYDEKLGRHLIATRDMKPGEVFAIEKAYGGSVNCNQISFVCAHCMCFAWTSIPCDNCVHVMYCTEKCKEEAWAEYHDIECSILPFIHCYKQTDIPIDMTLKIMLARIFITAVKREGLENVINEAKIIDNQKGMEINGFMHNGVFHSDKFRACYNLSSDQNSTYQENVADHFYATMLIRLLLRHSNVFHTKSNSNQSEIIDNNIFEIIKNIIIKLRKILKSNCYSFESHSDYECNCSDASHCEDDCTSTRGGIIASFCSLINHSCIPNTSRIFLQGRKIVLFTTTLIKKGQQLCCTYGPSASYLNKTERQNELLNGRNFICQCDACNANWSCPIENITSKKHDVKFFRQLLSEKDFQPNQLISLLLRLSKPMETWTYDEETLSNCIKICEFIYNRMEPTDIYHVFELTVLYREYIDKAFSKLYGEEFEIPNDCTIML